MCTNSSVSFFGGCFCLFCAQQVWQQHANDHKDKLYPFAPEASRNTLDDFKCCPLRLLKKLYMMVGKQNLELPDKAGFHVRRWISHQPEIVEEIPEQNQVGEINLIKTEFPTTKMLGVLWIVQEDKFSLRYSALRNEFVLTKNL